MLTDHPPRAAADLPDAAPGFDDGGVAIHQVLGVVPDAAGQAAMPAIGTWN